MAARKAADDGSMIDQTPKQLTGGVARPTRGARYDDDDERPGRVSIVYLGRMNSRGKVAKKTPVGEHIDVIVPEDEENEDAVADYAALVNVQNVPEDEREAFGVPMMTAEHVHLAGRHYHFTQGVVNHDVRERDVPFLTAHKVYKFVAAKRDEYDD